MDIIREYDNPYYKEKSRILGNCYTILTGKTSFHYEFIISGKEAKIKTDSLEYILDAVEAFRKDNRYISIFYTEDHSFYQSYEDQMTFKLPISILQVSSFFLCKEKLKLMDKYISNEETYLPVCIIDDEYVLLDGHHRLYLAYKNEEKMVNVYLEEPKPFIHDMIYIAKEQNLRWIKDLQILNKKEYQEIYNELKASIPSK